MLPIRENCDLDNPREHAKWALMHLPSSGGAVYLVHPNDLEEWSEHLVNAGFWDVEYLIEKFGRPDGTILVEDLPRRKIRYIPPIRGQQSPFNAASKWVPVDTPDPPRPKIPDLTRMTSQEVGGILEQAKALGYISDAPPTHDYAEVENG